GKHRLVLCMSSVTLLSVVVPARDLAHLPSRLAESVARLLRRIGVPPARVAREVREMEWVRFDRTASRSVLGSLNDYAFLADAYLRDPRPVAYLDELD